MNLAQILSLVIFMIMFIVIIIGKIHRYIPALIGAGLTLIVVYLIAMRDPTMAINAFSVQQIFNPRFWVPGHEAFESTGVNWQTIIFIGGMMLLIEGLGAVGFFRWLCLYVARAVKYRVVPILITFLLLSAFLSMFIDSITVMLFLATATIELARLLKFDPIPIIIAEIFAANTGGSATLCGDPPNIIIGTAFGFTFNDFIANTGVMALAGVIVALIFFWFFSRKVLTRTQGKLDLNMVYPQPKEAITDPALFIINTVIFLFVVLLLITHSSTGMSVATIGVIAAALTLIAARGKASHILKKLDWRTLLFFIGLFISVGAMENTGVLILVANWIGSISAGNQMLTLTIILWFSAFLSAIVDNIPLAATMVPVIRSLAVSQGMGLGPLAWVLSLGTDIGGNATPIGASANVVGTAIAAKEGYPVGWGRFMKYAAPATILVIGVIWVLVMIRY